MTDATSQAAQETTQAAGGKQQSDAGKTSTVTGDPAKAAAADTTQQQQQGNDGKQGDAKADAKADDKAKTGLPEKYEFKAPEGQTLDTALVDEFTPLARELGLTQEAAQKVVDLYAAKVLPRMQAAQQELQEQTVQKWLADAKADKELGGASFDKNATLAQKAVARFATPELKDFLNATGFGNHPEIIRFCARIGAAISESGSVVSGNAAGQKKSAEALFYPNQTS